MNLKNQLERTLPSTVRIVLIYLAFLLTFTLTRLIFLFYYGEQNLFRDVPLEIFRGFKTGFRYDTVVVFYALIPLVLWLILLRLFIGSQRLEDKINKAFTYYLSFFFFVFLFLLISDFQFYKFFQSHFNLLVFGILEDDTAAVMTSVLAEHPVVLILIILLISTWIFHKGVKRIITYPFSKKIEPVTWNVGTIIITILLFILGLRGSTGTFPLEKDDSVISSNQFINTLTMNGVFALKEAISERNRFSISTDTSKTFTAYGFPDFETAVQTYFELPSKPTFQQSMQMLVDTTSENPMLDSLKPNVIFIQMESMSNYYLNFHSPTFNLLGELETQLPHCFLFRDFVSIRNGTIHTLEGTMVNTPLTPLSQSQFLETQFSTSVARPYLEKGYETRFVTGAKLGWRNLDKFVENQYFNSAEGSATLLEKVQGAEACEWGVFDEFMFDRMYLYLEESKNPQFVFAMSTTNHTPFELPVLFKPHPVNLPDSVKAKLRCESEIAVKNFTNYQYANDVLGKFIKRVRESKFGKNTIIAASGDHNSFQTFDYGDALRMEKFGVPLVLYVPDVLKPTFVDSKGFGSHKDIFPTLHSLSLSKAPYLNAGVNLFDEVKASQNFAFNDFNSVFSNAGMVDLEANDQTYEWKNGYTSLGTRWPQNHFFFPQIAPVASQSNKNLVKLTTKAKAYKAIMTYLIQRECNGKPLFERKKDKKPVES